MRFSILSGAIKNAGDFLIVERSIKLLQHVFPNCAITQYNRSESLEDYIDEINASDALIFAGGPLLKEDMYPQTIPLVDNLNRIKTSCFTIGLGWYGKNTLEHSIYDNYKFNDTSRKLLKKVQQDFPISCRDWYSVRVLKNQGFANTIMTGCPAWYDIEHVHEKKLRSSIHIPFKKICISDPGYGINIERSYYLVQYICNKYPDAQVYYVFHRGIGSDEYTSKKRGQLNIELANRLKFDNIIIKDISYSADGFHIYDDCDLHIGFRVHAHIYNLSKRNVSILIEEDGRGAGVDEALGVWGVRPYNYIKAKENRVNLEDNTYFLKNIEDVLFLLEKDEYRIYESAFVRLANYYDVMIEYVKLLK